jgi:hypothetical protein
MKHGFTVGVLISLLFAVGCSQKQQVKVTYRSDPPRGTLHKLSGELWGTCPKVLYYDIDKDDIERGYLDAKGLMVRWPSGPAKRSGEMIRVTVDGTDRQVTFVQPEDMSDSSAAQVGGNADK